MHVRFSTTIGMPVIEEMTEEPVAIVSGILIQPDTAKVEGFFVRVAQFLRSEELFLASADIAHFGSRIRVRSEDVLAPVEDVLRLRTLLDDERTVLRQRVLTESERYLGRCMDVQFETKTFQLEWIFPKKFFRWQRPIPRSNIVQVRLDGIIVRDLIAPAKTTPAEAVLKTLEPLTTGTPVSSRVMHRSKR